MTTLTNKDKIMSKEQNNQKDDKALHIADVSKFDWQKFLDYVNTYEPKRLADDRADIIVKDLLYGIGISLDDSFRFADGYKRFMEDLKANF